MQFGEHTQRGAVGGAVLPSYWRVGELNWFLDRMSFSSVQGTVLTGFSLFEGFHRANPTSATSEKSKLSSPFGLNGPPEASLSYTLIEISASTLPKVCAMDERYKICGTVWPFCTWARTLRGLRDRCVEKRRSVRTRLRGCGQTD